MFIEVLFLFCRFLVMIIVTFFFTIARFALPIVVHLDFLGVAGETHSYFHKFCVMSYG